MFDIGWTEMLVIAVVLIVIVGPKDLPKMLRTFGKSTAKLRSMAGDFQRQFNEALKEAELDDVKKSVDSLRGLNPMNEIRKQLNPLEKAAADVKAGVDAAMKPMPAPAAAPAATDPAGALAQPAEPLKGGATAMPAGGPTAMPDPVVVPGAPQPAATAASAATTAKASASKAKTAPAKAAAARTGTAPAQSAAAAKANPAAAKPAKAADPIAAKAPRKKPADKTK